MALPHFEMSTSSRLPKSASGTSPEDGTRRKIRSSEGAEPILHLIAGIILLAYAFSHFGFLTLNDMNLGFYNTVFPFLTNWKLFLITGIIELLLGLFCIRYRGSIAVNLLIWTFIAMMVWYRWAFFFTGGKSCSCLGLVGQLLHVNRVPEKVIPIATLVILAAATIPFLWRQRRIFRRKWFPGLTTGLILSALPLQSTAKADETKAITIRGTIELQEYNPKTGQPYTQQRSSGVFVAKIQGNAWMFNVANKDRPSWWISFMYDGTNGFTLGPSGGAFFDKLKPPSTNECQAIVMGSMLYQPFVSDPLGASICWVTYGISSSSVKQDERGIFSLPLPWNHPRNTPAGYGYRWNINFASGGRFVDGCEIVRDKSFDLDEKSELFREEIDYPDTPADYNTYKASLLVRKDQPDGFVEATYKVTEWYETNGMSIPVASNLKINLNPQWTEHPWRVIDLRALNVGLSEAAGPVLESVPKQTKVQDYRYKKYNSSRIFKYAEYTLNPGEFWRSDNDPLLAAQANDWLKHGQKYTSWGGAHQRYIVWAFLVVLLLPLAILGIRWALKNKQQTKTTV